MSEIGYNGRDIYIEYDPGTGYERIAVINSKSLTHGREPVDVTSDDDIGWRRLLPRPARRMIDVPIEGVVATTNLWLLDSWAADTMIDCRLVYPDGSTSTAEDGFFLGNLEMSGPEEEHVAFSGQLQSSGPVTVVRVT